MPCFAVQLWGNPQTQPMKGIIVNLLDIVYRLQPPLPWQEGDNIPWHEPDFSARMLVEHLEQSHDLASRRSHIIDQHVAWIHELFLGGGPARILDLGCGPGLYSNRFAALGHTCVGIDYSPASIAYAKKSAAATGRAAVYHLADMRAADFGGGFDLAMLLYGELNVFSRDDATHILAKVYAALRPGGLLLLEPHTRASLIPKPDATRSWFSSTGGLFASTPHLVLTEEHWDATANILTRRYYIIDTNLAAVDGVVNRFAQSMQAYNDDEYAELLAATGFAQIDFFPGLAHDRVDPPPKLLAIVATKPN
jgi:SAM-dependent methyltransferase